MFVNDDGCIKLKKPFPKRMTWFDAEVLSIRKWEFILSEVKAEKDIHSDGGHDTCALCYRAGVTIGYGACNLCPIMKKTGMGSCDGTPYEGASFSDYAEKNVQAEIDFLKSL